MIMVHELPFAFTEYELFTLLMKTASPHYVRISHATAKADCWTSYEVEKKRLNGLLKIVDRISITTDMWKSGQKIQYIVLTAHFVDSDWNLQKRVLNFVDMPPLHSGVFAYDTLYKFLQDWDIEGKVCSIFMENASYNDATIRMLKYSLSFHKMLYLNENLFHVSCCAHILNLLVHDGLFEIEDVIDNVRESVKHIRTSTVHLTMFSDNVTYAMLSCVLEFKDVFPQYAQCDASYKYLPSDKDWVRVEEVRSFLTLFNEVTNIISSKQFKYIYIKELLMEKSLSEELWMKQMTDKM
ncbi:hypothetical protein ES332_A13G144900v1 [Gossypium tomentosum]|uniref:hAT-like transposase RNase-H fold domain-containing protein n=1 Tax=Gossypium tomentosum TaxID=34277 RepID=A0A5D2MK62_GOSTO|nr:hypothetical protein ES332_A13G144900v1 [Gossypium tomentosum]